MVVEKVDLRCPYGRDLLGKVLSPLDVTDEHLPIFEVNCRFCVKRMRKDEPDVSLVLHRFDVGGKLVHSVIERRRDG